MVSLERVRQLDKMTFQGFFQLNFLIWLHSYSALWSKQVKRCSGYLTEIQLFYTNHHSYFEVISSVRVFEEIDKSIYKYTWTIQNHRLLQVTVFIYTLIFLLFFFWVCLRKLHQMFPSSYLSTTCEIFWWFSYWKIILHSFNLTSLLMKNGKNIWESLSRNWLTCRLFCYSVLPWAYIFLQTDCFRKLFGKIHIISQTGSSIRSCMLHT